MKKTDKRSLLGYTISLLLIFVVAIVRTQPGSTFEAVALGLLFTMFGLRFADLLLSCKPFDPEKFKRHELYKRVLVDAEQAARDDMGYGLCLIFRDHGVWVYGLQMKDKTPELWEQRPDSWREPNIDRYPTYWPGWEFRIQALKNAIELSKP